MRLGSNRSGRGSQPGARLREAVHDDTSSGSTITGLRKPETRGPLTRELVRIGTGQLLLTSRAPRTIRRSSIQLLSSGKATSTAPNAQTAKAIRKRFKGLSARLAATVTVGVRTTGKVWVTTCCGALHRKGASSRAAAMAQAHIV